MSSTKVEGFDPSYNLSQRQYRPDGDYLSYAPQPHSQPTIVSQSPYGLTQHLPSHLEYSCSPHNSALNFTSPPTQTYPGLYGVTYKPAPHLTDGSTIYTPASFEDSSVSPDCQRPSNIGKIPTVKSKTSRKMSVHDGRRHDEYTSSRPATVQGHHRAMSQNDVFGPAPGSVDTRVHGNSMAPHYANGYNVPVPRSAGSWPGRGPMNSYYEGSMDQGTDSPITPARSTGLNDESYKRQRRRECHNQVEKRRREHINSKIEELGRLLPAALMEQVGADEEDHLRSKRKKRKAGSAAKKTSDASQCKGTILSKTVQYLTDLGHKNDMLKALIQQLEAALGSSAPVPMPLQNTHQSYWNHTTTPVRRDVQYTTSPTAPSSNYHPRYMVPDSERLEVMRPSPEPEAQTDERFQMSWGNQILGSTGAIASGSGSASDSPNGAAEHSDSTYSPDNDTSTLHSSFSSHDSSPTGARLDLQPTTTGKPIEYPLNPINGNNGLGLEFVPGPMEMQVGHGNMGW